jgi:hypothetical protein
MSQEVQRAEELTLLHPYRYRRLVIPKVLDVKLLLVNW